MLDTGGGAVQAMVEVARAQLVGTGAVELAGFLNPTGIEALVADADELVCENNRTATRDALAAGAGRRPTLDEALEYRDRALNAYHLPPGVT